MKTLRIWFFTAVLLVPASASAQGRFELTPFVGYETSSRSWVTVNSGGPDGIVDGLRANDGLAFGTFVDYSVFEKFQLEFMWNRNPTSYSAPNYTNRHYFKAFDSTIDQYQFGALYTFLDSRHAVRPYIAGGLGFTEDLTSPLSPDGDAPPNRTAFAWSIGGGLKYYVNRHIGLRGDFRYLPTRGGASPTTHCNPLNYCYNGSYPSYLSRGNFVGGILFRF